MVRRIHAFLIILMLLSFAQTVQSCKQKIELVETFEDVGETKGLHSRLSEEVFNYSGSPDELLVVFNFDETLISHSPYYRVIADTLKELAKTGGMDKASYEAGLVISVMNHLIFRSHKNFPKLISDIQKKAKTICLTASRIGPLGNKKSGNYIPSAEEFRIKQLKRFGYDFNNKLHNLNYPEQHEFKEPKGEKFAFHKGVLLTNNIEACDETTNLSSKGLVLYRFLFDLARRNDGWFPKKIIFADDKLDFLESVKKAAIVLDIDYLGLHYTEQAKKLEEGVKAVRANQNWVDTQFTVLTKDGIWQDTKWTGQVPCGNVLSGMEKKKRLTSSSAVK